MPRPDKKALSRRHFMKYSAFGLGAIGLSRISPMIVGCFPVSSPLYGKEMVGNVTGDSALIKLVAGDLCQPSARHRLLYDTTSHIADPSSYGFQTPVVSGFQEHDAIDFHLTPLVPNTHYYYRYLYDLGDGWQVGEERSFHTQRASEEGFRFCIATDTHITGTDPRGVSNRYQTFRNILADTPDVLITLGDDMQVANQANYVYLLNSPEDFLLNAKKLRQIIDICGHSMFYLPVLGNHEGLYGWAQEMPEYSYVAEARSRYYPVPSHTTFPEGGDPLGRYGAFTWGNSLFVWLDVVGFCALDPLLNGTNADYILGDAQRAFLVETLRNSSATWKFVFSHHLFGGHEGCLPSYPPSARYYGRGNANVAHLYDQAFVQQQMIQEGASVFFYGHDHVFSVSECDGISYVCCGIAGNKCSWIEDLEVCYRPYTNFVMEDGDCPWGHVRVDVYASRLEISYIRSSSDSDNGSVISTYTVDL